MTDEPAMIQVTAGPYAGQRLTMSRADADAAIAEKWAVDPNAPAPAKEEEAKPPLTEEERADIKAKAEKAARKLRGEEEKPEGEKSEPVTRDLDADKPSSRYPTRDIPRR